MAPVLAPAISMKRIHSQPCTCSIVLGIDMNFWIHYLDCYHFQRHRVTFGDSLSFIELILSIRCQYFFSKSNSFRFFFPKLYWIESTTNKIIAKSIHFKKITIIYHFSTIKKGNWFFHRFDGSTILKISAGNNLGDNYGFLMIWVGSITSPKVSPDQFDPGWLLIDSDFFKSIKCT